jgi:hypothetical protein
MAPRMAGNTKVFQKRKLERVSFVAGGEPSMTPMGTVEEEAIRSVRLSLLLWRQPKNRV